MDGMRHDIKWNTHRYIPIHWDNFPIHFQYKHLWYMSDTCIYVLLIGLSVLLLWTCWPGALVVQTNHQRDLFRAALLRTDWPAMLFLSRLLDYIYIYIYIVRPNKYNCLSKIQIFKAWTLWAKSKKTTQTWIRARMKSSIPIYIYIYYCKV